MNIYNINLQNTLIIIFVFIIIFCFYNIIRNYFKISHFQTISNTTEKTTIEDLKNEIDDLKKIINDKININIEYQNCNNNTDIPIPVNPIPNISIPVNPIPVNPIIEYDRKKLYDPLIDPSQRYVASQVPTPEIASITNIATQNIYDSYHRIGLLISENNDNVSLLPENQVLELFSRMLYQNFYQYYTAITMGQKIIKITINREGGQEYYNGNSIYIPELKTTYKVQIDKRDQIYYNPYFPNGV